MSAYATRSDLYLYGLPRGLLANPGRLVASALDAGDIFTLDQHGFEDDDALLFRAEEGGSLPGGITAGTTYYAIRVSDSTFQVSASAGGAAVTLTSNGTSVVVSPSLEPMVDALLEKNSRLFDSYLPAHEVPLESPFPAVATASVAQLTALEALMLMGQASALITAQAEQTRREMGRLAKGIPLRDSNATAPANLASVATITVARGWDDTDANTIP